MTLALLVAVLVAASDPLAAPLAGLDATMVVREVETGTTWVHAPERAATRYLPCSTFKIPNTLIALEAGVLADASTRIAFDPARDLRSKHDSDERWAELSQDHDLRSAFGKSVVWYYREVARRVGEERMREGLRLLDYGNRDMSAGLDAFWLKGPMGISAHEQVAFLERSCGLKGTPPVSARSIAVLRDVMKADEGEGWTLHAKTGSGEAGGRKLGWYVGWVERDGRTYAFAMNVLADDWATVFDERKRRTRAALKAVGALP